MNYQNARVTEVSKRLCKVACFRVDTQVMTLEATNRKTADEFADHWRAGKKMGEIAQLAHGRLDIKL